MLLLQSFFQTAAAWVFVKLNSGGIVQSTIAWQSEQERYFMAKHYIVSALRKEVVKDLFSKLVQDNYYGNM